MEATDEIATWKLEHAKRLAEEKRLQLRRLDLPVHVLEQLGRHRATLAIEAVGNRFGILVLSGNPGVGKTFAAVHWLAAFVNDDANWTEPGTAVRLRGRPPILVTAAALARWDRYEQEPMLKLLRAPRLAVDDLGAEYLDKNGFYAALLDEIVNERYSARLPTLLTTNLSAEDFKQRYGERIAGRIRETGGFIACGGEDLRRQHG